MFDIFGPQDPQKALQKANEYIRDGKTSSAIKILEDNLTEDDSSFDLYLDLARLYFHVEERAKAVKVLRQIKSIVPAKIDEIIALLSELYYQHVSIDIGDFLIQLYVEQQKYDEINKLLKQLSDRELRLLITKYDKIKQNIDSKNVVSENDFQNILICASLRFFANQGQKALEAIDAMIEVEVYGVKLLNWARLISREFYNNWYASILLLKIQIVNHDFENALSQAQRTADKFADSVDSLIAIISAAKPPKELEPAFAKFLTDLYIKKGDLDASIELLLELPDKDAKKIDDVIKGLRELERIDPNNVKILYALGDAYIKAQRVTLAVGEFEKILEIDQSQYEQVVQKFKEAFEKEPNNPEVIDSLVKVHLSQNDVDSAVDIIETAYKADPGILGEYIVNLNMILEKDLNNAKALYFLGLCYARRGDHDNALLIFDNLMDNKEFEYVDRATQQICREKPDDAQYVNLRAKSMIMMGNEKEAFSLLTSFVNQNSDKAAVFLPTLDTLLNRRPELSKDIIPIYEQYRREDPFIAELTMARGYAFAGDYKKSVNIFERLFANEENKDSTKRALIEVIKERPRAVPLLLAAARIFMKEGEVEIATQFFKTAQMVDPQTFFEIVDEFYDALKAFPKDREVRTLLVETFFNRKIWDKVIEESQRAIEVFGGESQYFYLKLGEALVENGNLSDAVRPLMLSLDGKEDYSHEVLTYLDKILGIDKSNVPAHFARGRALSKAHRVSEAVEEYLLTVRIVPARAKYVCNELKILSSKAMANPLVLFALGSVEFTLKRYNEAIKHLLQSCELDTTLVKRVIPLYEKLIESTSSPLLEFSLAKANHLAGLTNSAIKYYVKAQANDKAYREPVISEMKKICAENPDDFEARKGLAEIYFNYNNLEDSLDLMSEVYKLDPQETDWAKNFVSHILQKNPQHIPSYYFFADIFMKEKSHRKAIEVYQKLIEISPSEITNVINILQNFKEKSGDLLLYLGSLFKDTGEIKEAITLFDELFTQDTSFGNEIVNHIKEILKKNANLGEAYLLAHKIFVFQQKYEKALDAIRYAEELMPENEEIILKEGQTYYEMGDAEKAIKLYTDLLESAHDRNAIYRLIRKTRGQYFKEKIEMIEGNEDKARLERARLYLLIGKPAMAEKELDFAPQDDSASKHHTMLRAKLFLKKNRPLDALEIMRNLPIDGETASVYADIYEALGSYEAAAQVLRKAGVEGMTRRIASYEKLAQERRLAQGRYFIEGRS